MATITKLPSGAWRVQVRRKGKYASEAFLRRGDGEAWAGAVEHKIDRGEPILCDATTKTLGSLIDLHKGDLAQVGKSLGRSKAASLEFLSARLGKLWPAELDREKLITFGKERARKSAGPVTLSIDLGHIIPRRGRTWPVCVYRGRGSRPRCSGKARARRQEQRAQPAPCRRWNQRNH